MFMYALRQYICEVDLWNIVASHIFAYFPYTYYVFLLIEETQSTQVYTYHRVFIVSNLRSGKPPHQHSRSDDRFFCTPSFG